MDKALRNTLRNVVTQCRKILEDAIAEILQGRYGIHKTGAVEKSESLTHLSHDEIEHRERVIAHLKHIDATTPRSKRGKSTAGTKDRENYEPAAVEQLIREAAFTHLNRLCAYKMMAQRGLVEDAVGKVLKSRGFLFYLADHPEDEALYNGAQGELAYRHFLEWQNGNLSAEIGVLYAKDDVASGLFPPHRTLEAVLEKLNQEELKNIWAEDETIGWIFQYFTPKELRDKARQDSAAPRNSNEMAFRNQFFTPRYVVEFLVDNTLGRTWYEMRSGDTSLKEKCRYLAQSPVEGPDKDQSPKAKDQRLKKDPREIKVLDPACGSGHFLLYCFDLLQTIYEEAYSDSELGRKLQQDFPNAEEFKRQIPVLILTHNIYGIDIDLRVTQLAGLALWLRAQRAFQEMGLKAERPQIKRMNLICAEPMPGEVDLLEELIAELQPHPLGELIGQLVRNVFERMKLAGETGALLRIEDDISEPIDEARKQWQEMLRSKAEGDEEFAEKNALFDYRREEAHKKLIFDIADITSERVWHNAEEEALKTLRDFAKRASNGKGLSRRLFAEDAEQGFAFIDLCRQKFDVVLMNPPFGDASMPSKPYIDETYGDTRGDVYKAFVECFQDRLVPAGFLGIISSRAGFFLSLSSDWRQRVVLRLYRPLLLADFGMGVLDAMVETAAYVLRSLSDEEDRQLTLQLARDLLEVPTDKNDLFSTKRYEGMRALKRHQANGELRRLCDAGFIRPVEGHFPRWSPLHGEIAKAPAPSNVPYPSLVCLRLLGDHDKGRGLEEALQNKDDARRFVVAPEDFRQVPNAPFCYWVSNDIRRLFIDLPPFEIAGRTAKQGMATSDDFRFARMWWEVPVRELCPPSAHPSEPAGSYCVLGKYRWFPFAKGGSFSPYYADLHLVVNWERDGGELKAWAGSLYNESHWSRIIKNTDLYFHPGLTYPRRLHKMAVMPLPSGSIISVRGSGIYASKQDLLSVAAIFSSAAFDFLVKVMLGRFGHPQFDNGTLCLTPVPPSVFRDGGVMGTTAAACIALLRNLDSASDTSHLFYLPALFQVSGDTLAERSKLWEASVAEAERQLVTHQRNIDDIAFRLYGISDQDRKQMSEASGQASVEAIESESEDEDESSQPATDHRLLTTDLLSYAVGCVIGRWDARFATGERARPKLPDPFAPLPVCAPGALTGEDGSPLSEVPADYPLRVDSDGILVDDSTHADDIISRAREVFELMWPTAAEAREREVCELLGVKELRDYFRKLTAGGFWMDHVRRYSRSRRKAPIYWLLRSSKGNYAIWLYYHRLDKDVLYKALLNYVEPKLRLEENNLAQLRQRRETVGTTGREGKQLEKELDKQESFISELHDFHGKLKRAADLHLEPDLNDGVVLNIAPLWELVPWTEAKKYWKELTEGKYEWSSISKQLRAKGLIKS
jgi:hypothetical protein